MRKRPTVQRMATLGGALLMTLVMAVPASAGGSGATQVAGIGYPDDGSVCGAPPTTDPAPDYRIRMTGDLEGCVYGYITSGKGPGPSGVYKERADETFVGSYDGHEGSFRMTENFHAKFDLDTFDELFGFCKHPIVKGSGSGDFEGVLGRLDFRDVVDDPTHPFFPYKGHLRNLD